MPMSTIDNLNFKIILDDSDFNARVKADIEAAKKLNTTVSSLLNFRKDFAKAANDLAAAMNKESSSSKKMAESYSALKKKMADVNEEARRQSTLLRSLKGYAGAYFSIEGARRFITELTRVTGEFEKQQVSLRAILQDSSGADVLFERIKSLAVESPFSVLDLTSYAKQLSAFSVPLDEIYDTTKMLADVSAGLGVDMSRIVLAYGQIRSASFLRGQEVRQLTEAGIPILDELAKQFTELEGRAVSVGEVFDKISAREVPFQMVEKAFKDMTSEGGKFYQMQEVLADTLSGKISNLQDSFQIMLSSMGEANSGILKGSVDLLTSMMNNYDKIGQDLLTLAASYGAYQLVLYGTTIKTKGLVKANLSLVKSFFRIKAAIVANPYALAAAGAIAAAYAVYRLVTAQSAFEKAEKSLKNIVDNCNASIDSETMELEYLLGKLKKAKVGTEEYNEVRDRILDTYGQYLTAADKEALLTGKIADEYDRLAESIQNAAKARAMESGLTEIESAKAEEQQTVFKNFNSATKNAPKGIKVQLRDYVQGKSAFEDLTEAAKEYFNTFNPRIITKSTGFGSYTVVSSKQNIFDTMRDELKDIEKRSEDLKDELKEALDFVYEPTGGTKTTNPTTTDYKQVQNALENRIALVKEMAAAYSKMKDAGIGDETIRGKFDEVYPEEYKDLYESFDFNTTLDKLERQLTKANSNVVRSAESALRRDKIDEFTAAFTESSKALEKWLDFYNEISESMPESSEDSFGARVQRVLNKLSANNYKTGDSADKAMANLAASESAKIEADGQAAWEQYYNEGKAAIEKWAEAVKRANRDVAQQAMQSLGKSYLDTFFTSRGIDMTNLGDKSFGQLQTMLDSLREVDMDNLIPEDVVKRAEELGVKIQPMVDFIKQTVNAKEQDVLGAMFSNISEMANASRASLDDVESSLKRIAELKRIIAYKQENNLSTTSEENELMGQTELFKKRLKSPAVWMSGIAEATKKAAGYMKELAVATGNVNMGAMADAMSSVAQNLSAAAQGAATGGWIGAIVGGVTDAADQIITAVINEKAAIYKTKLAMEEFGKQLAEMQYHVSEEDYETIFGVRTISKSMEAYEKAQKALIEYNELVSKAAANPDLEDIFRPILTDEDPTGVNNVVRMNLRAKYNTLKAAYEKGYSELESTLVMTKHRGYLAKEMFGKNNEYATLKDTVPELFDENGFNYENAKTFLSNKDAIRYWDTYNKGVVEAIQNLVTLKEDEDEALKIIDNQLSDMFSDTVSDLTDIIFDAVMNGADAWDQFREKGSEAILELGKQLMQEMMINEYLEPYKEQMREAYKSGDIQETQEKMRDITANMYGGLMDLVPMLQASAEQWVDWMKREGYDPTASGGSLSEGIKSITEDTANLLASYLNAIRSDVSQIRVMQSAANEKMAAMLDALPKAPTLADYLTKIEAHTANISADTSAILKQLRSVITTQGGSTAISVYM